MGETVHLTLIRRMSATILWLWVRDSPPDGLPSVRGSVAKMGDASTVLTRLIVLGTVAIIVSMTTLVQFLK
jgi:hypothetical protein